MASRIGENEKPSRPVLDSRRQVLSAVIAAYPGGREGAAALLGIDLKKFDNRLYENPGHRPLTDDQIRQLERVTGTTFLADYMCGLYGGVFVAMPDDTPLDNLDLYVRSLATDVAEGRVDQIIAKALEDGRLDEGELADIVAAHRQHIAARHSEVGAVITLHRKNPGSQEP
ncbi:YmfL family putative regulatory protein [Pseudomonas kuykendallii]|uniref:YmfL family putative regulatory protein n=1 Tax=Pseudomonas kuykendallii TaxID=1007099 RepID=UPI00235543C7|nr:YmfL family putative regulatory protein [Pseudomonas kuykendallii]